jgi:cyclophilin family peptidyl-prolyl cis-trans isomerase
VTNNLYLDEFGNEFVEFPLRVQIPDPGQIRFDDLKIEYSCTIEAGDGVTYHTDVKENPFSDKLNKYIKAHKGEANQDGDLEIKLELSSPTTGRIKMHDFFLEYNHEPKLTLITPSTNTKIVEDSLTTQVEINWVDSDIDDNAQVSLYYHKGKFLNYEGNLIVANISENDPSNSFTWEFSEEDVKDGTYSIFGMITDGVNVIYSYAPGVIDLTWKHPEPPYIKIIEPDGKLDKVVEKFRIEWSDSGNAQLDEPTGAMIELYYSPVKIQNISGITAHATKIDTNGYIYENEDGNRGEFIWDVKGLPNGTSWYVIGTINDGINPLQYHCSDHRVIKDYIIPPDDFSIVDGKEIIPDRWETHNTRPQLSWKMPTSNYIFFITVYQGSSNTGIKIFEAKNITEFNIDIDSPLGELEYGKTYFAEIYAMSFSGGYSSIVNITFTIVNNLPAAPTVNFSPKIPSSSESLVCLEPPEKFDVDGDPITYWYEWYKDTGDGPKHQSDFDGIRTIPSDELKKNEEWTVKVIPSDNIGTGPAGTASVTIWNTLPTIQIENPTKGGTYYSNIEVNVYATWDDEDDDVLTVKWFLDLDINPKEKANMTKLIVGQYDPIEFGGIEALKFEKKFSAGKHNLTLLVQDGDVGKKFEDGVVETVVFTVEAGGETLEGKEKGESLMATIAISSILIIIVIVVLIIVFLQLRKRKPKSEREQLYGKDKGLKPGEMYPVEGDESTETYFGDALDRKGVSSLEGATPPPATPAPEKTETIAAAKQPPQLPPQPEKPESTPKPPEKK